MGSPSKLDMVTSCAGFRTAAIVAAMTVILGAFTLFRGQNAQVQLVLVGRDGRKTAVGTLPNNTFAPRVSPDGKRIAYDLENGSLWVADIDNVKAARRFTQDQDDRYPMWAEGGQQIAFISERDGQQTLYMKRSDGTGAAQRLAVARAPESWNTPNQMFSFITLAGHYGISTYSMKDKNARVLIDSPNLNQHSSQFSPNGKWIAYSSTETGDFEVYVQPFPLTGAKYRISRSGGGHAEWSPDGKELFFDNKGQLFVSTIQSDGKFLAGTPAPLPITGFIQGNARRQYDLMPDGKQFLM